jgi:hypothetical protein
MNANDIEKNLVAISENGQTLSPILPEGVKNYLIDIDGTVCDDIPNEEPERMLTAEVYSDALITLNKWYDEGHIIFFFTSRTEAHREYTEIWLKKHGFKYQTSRRQLPLDRQPFGKSNPLQRKIYRFDRKRSHHRSFRRWKT